MKKEVNLVPKFRVGQKVKYQDVEVEILSIFAMDGPDGEPMVMYNIHPNYAVSELRFLQENSDPGYKAEEN